ncbi:MAG: hypothetical protein GC192_16090 [Bacteroidetes bacterium]|nr:hypothetical protein [Bacteroidota bacterium]
MKEFEEEEDLGNLSVEEKVIRFQRLLENIERTNSMIRRSQESDDWLGVKQYQRLKKQFMDELAELLGTYELEVQIQDHTLQKAA